MELSAFFLKQRQNVLSSWNWCHIHQHPAHREKQRGERRDPPDHKPSPGAQGLSPKHVWFTLKWRAGQCGVSTRSAVCPLLRTEGGTAQPWPSLPALFMILHLSSSFTSGVCGVSHKWCLKTSDLVPSLNLSSRPLSSRDGTHAGGWPSSGVLCSHLFRTHYPFRRKKIKLLDSRRKADKGLPARNADSRLL